MFKASVQEARLTCQPFLGNAIAARLLLGGVPCSVWLRTAGVDSCRLALVRDRSVKLDTTPPTRRASSLLEAER